MFCPRVTNLKSLRIRPLAAAAVAVVSAGLLLGTGQGSTSPSPLPAMPAAADGRVTVTDLGTMGRPAGAAVDVNNLNVVIGNAFDPATGQSAPVGWMHGEGHNLDLGDSTHGRSLQLSDGNLVIGTLDTSPGVTHAVHWDRHGRRHILRPEAEFSAAVDLNEHGDVLLWYALANGADPAAEPDSEPGGDAGTTEHVSIWHHGWETPVLPALSGAEDIDPGLRLRPVAFNHKGEVAITAEDADGAPAGAYHWSNGHLTDLGSLGGGSTLAAAIDEQGRIAGTSRDGQGRDRAFLWEGGAMVDLGTLGGERSRVVPDRRAMSDAGHVIGFSEDAEGNSRAFVWKDGEMHDLGTLGGGEPEPAAVNDRGWVAGRDKTADGQQHAFFWDGGAMVDLGTLGGEMSRAYALNENGLVAGVSLTDTGAHHAVLWTVQH